MFVVNATDADEPETPNVDVTFSLEDSSLPFMIDPVLGNITTLQGLLVRDYEVVVVATDDGSPSLSSTVSFYVTVAAPNSYDPVFDEDLQFSVVEEEVNTDVAFEFYVYDSDTSDEGRVALSLIPSDYSNAFNLSFSYDNVQERTVGRLFQVQPFDRESINNFTLSISAVDQGNELFRRTSEANITVIVSDINDNGPIFVDSPYTVRVAEGTNISTVVFQVVVEDSDIDENAEITYQIDTTEFTIDAQSGNISVNTNLDRRRQSFYSFNVTATDGGVPRFSNTTTVDIIVTEVNDNSPFFDPLPPETITIPENTPPGYVLLNITAGDNDTLSAGEVTILLAQTGNIFALNDDDQLILNEDVDYEVRLVPILRPIKPKKK